MLRRRWRALIPAVVLGILLAATGIVGLLGLTGPRTPPSSPYEVSLGWEGTPVVGMDFSIVVDVRSRPGFTSQGPTFLSLDAGGFEILQGDSRENPWGRPNVWNLTGLDLSGGRRFVWQTTPTWGCENVPAVELWSPRGSVSDVVFLNADVSLDAEGSLDSRTVTVWAYAGARWQIEWPLHLAVTAGGNFTVGGDVRVDTRVQGAISGPRAPSLLFLSLELNPTYYRNRSADTDDDPWGLATIWNLTGVDLSGGIQFSLDVTPALRAARVPLEARAWSPRTSWTALSFDETGELQNPEAIRFWGSLTVDFPIA